jgi:hypothetical protein
MLASIVWYCLSVCPYFRSFVFVFAIILGNYWLGFHWTLIKDLILLGNAHVICLSWSDHSTYSYRPWPVMQYVYIVIFGSGLFHCNSFKQNFIEAMNAKRRCIKLLSVCPERTVQCIAMVPDWLVMQCVLRVTFVSVLFHINYLPDFNKTLLEPSIPKGDAHGPVRQLLPMDQSIVLCSNSLH